MGGRAVPGDSVRDRGNAVFDAHGIAGPALKSARQLRPRWRSHHVHATS